MLPPFHFSMRPTLAASFQACAWAIVMLATLGLVSSGSAQPPRDVDPRLAKWIAELGSPAYEDREGAFARIVEMGETATPALREATLSPDLEIARRAQRAVERIRQIAFDRRVATYLRGEPLAGPPLVAQTRYESLCGTDPPDREFYVAMLAAERDLAQEFDRDPERFPDAFRTRFEEVIAQVNSRSPSRTPPPVESIAALLLILVDPSIGHSESAFPHGGWSLLTNQAYFQTAVAAPQRGGERLRAIVGEWILAPSSTLDVSAKSRMAIELELPQGLAFAAKYAFDEEVLPNARPYAMQALAVLGKREHGARLLPALADESICTTRYLPDKDGKNVRMPIQMRDVALGWALFLTEQDPRAYGFTQLEPVFDRVRSDPANVHSASNFWFASDEARDAALVKWNAWLAANPFPEPPALAFEAR